MNRNEFVKRVIRYLLFGLLAVIALITGNRVASRTNCSSCPGKGICAGVSDCSKFLPE